MNGRCEEKEILKVWMSRNCGQKDGQIGRIAKHGDI